MAKYFHPSYSRFFTTDNGGVYNSKTGRELGNKPSKNGYIRISIRPRGSNPISLLKHEFIWEAFNNEETNKFFKIIHIDGDKLNNRPDNLKRIINESSNPEGQSRKILATNLSTNEKRFFNSIYQASKALQINAGSIKLISDGKRKTARSKLNSNKYSFKYSNPNDLNVVKVIKDKIKKKILKKVCTNYNSQKYFYIIKRI